MSFQDVYREEVIESRRSRGRTARFIGRVIGVVLGLGFMATLQKEPELRQSLMDAGMQGVARVTGMELATSETVSDLAPQTTSLLPPDRVPVTRAGQRVSN